MTFQKTKHPLLPASPRAKLIALSFAVIAMVTFYYFKTWHTMDTFVKAIDHCDLLFCDFVRHYYVMGKYFFSLKAPVGGYFYPPLFALFLTLFSSFPLETATWLWGFFQAVTMLLLFLGPAIYFFKKSTHLYYLYLFLFITSLPLLHNFKWGQVSVLITLCVLGTLYFYRKDRKIISAVLLALSMSVKYYTAVFLIFFLIKKDFRFIGIFLIALFFFMAVVPSIAIGVDSNIQFYKMVHRNIAQFKAWISQSENSQYLAYVIPRLNEGINRNPVNRIILRVGGYAIFFINIFIIFSLKKLRLSPGEDIYWGFTLLFLSLPMILETSWPHYFVYLPICLTFLVSHFLVKKKTRGISNWLVLIFLAVSGLLSSSIFFNIIGNWQTYSGSGYLFFSNTILLIICYHYLFQYSKQAEFNAQCES
jgi:hypothetical protein